jgi:hypothetical protein
MENQGLDVQTEQTQIENEGSPRMIGNKLY